MKYFIAVVLLFSSLVNVRGQNDIQRLRQQLAERLDKIFPTTIPGFVRKGVIKLDPSSPSKRSATNTPLRSKLKLRYIADASGKKTSVKDKYIDLTVEINPKDETSLHWTKGYQELEIPGVKYTFRSDHFKNNTTATLCFGTVAYSDHTHAKSSKTTTKLNTTYDASRSYLDAQAVYLHLSGSHRNIDTFIDQLNIPALNALLGH